VDRKNWLIMAATAAAVLVAVVLALRFSPHLLDRLRGVPDDPDPWQVAARQESIRRKTAGSGRHAVELDEEDLRNLFIVELAKTPDGRRLLDVAAEVEADVRNGGLRLGLLIDLSKVDGTRLDEDQRESVRKAEQLLSVFGRSEIVLAIEGVPRAADGRVAFGPETGVRLAFLEMTYAEFAERFGVGDEHGDGFSFALREHRVLEVEVLTDALKLVLEPRQ
jgi:hypothetical protein